jgi:predicted RNA methylase
MIKKLNIILFLIILFFTLVITRKKNKENFVYSISDKDEAKFKKDGYASTYGFLSNKGVQQIIYKAIENYKNKSIKNKIFIDLGSGDGSVVMYAAIFDFKKVIGVELSTDRHNVAIKKKKKSKNKDKIILHNGDLLKYDISNVDIIYISSLCFSDEILKKIANKIAKEVKKGTLIFSSKELINKKLKKIDQFPVEQSWDLTSDIVMYSKD